MAGLTRKGKTYYALFSVDGKTRWKRIGNISYKDALRVLKDMEANFDKDRVGLRDNKPITFNQYASLYLGYSQANKAYRSWERDIASLKALTTYFGDILLEVIGNQNIELYKSKRQKDGVKPRTINIELLCISSMLRRAVEWNYLNRMPKIKLLKQEKKPPKFLSPEEMEKLLECSSPWLAPILLVLRNTGFRARELINLKWEDIDLNRNFLLVRNNKGNSYHTISMTEELKTTLLFLRDNYVRHDGKIISREAQQMVYVFCHPNGKPIKSFKRSFYKAVRKAELKNVSPHIIRHSVASNLVMQGVDLRAIQLLLGHKDISTTMIYAHVSSEHVARSLDKLPWAKPKLKLASE